MGLLRFHGIRHEYFVGEGKIYSIYSLTLSVDANIIISYFLIPKAEGFWDFFIFMRKFRKG